MACILAAALLACVSTAHGQVIEEDGFPIKGEGVFEESFSLSCPPRLYARAGETVAFSCTATGVSEEGVRYEWESLSGEDLRLLSDAQALAPLFTASLPAGAEYAYRLTAAGPGVHAAASVTVTVEGVPEERVRAPGLQEECDLLAIPDEPGERCAEDKGPVPFGFGPEEEFPYPEAPYAPDRPFGPVDRESPPRLECPAAIFLEELETGSIECHAWDISGEEYLEYMWEPAGSTTRDYLENPRLLPEDSPTPSVIAPEAPAHETLESFHSGEATLRYRYRLTATSRATGLSSHAEVEVYVSSSRPVVYCPLEVVVEEGETVALDCEGADPLSFRMDYDEDGASVLWEWEGLWGTDTSPLAATDLSSPLFTAPVGSAGSEYHYIASMTTRASGVPRTARRKVTVIVGESGEEAAIAELDASAPARDTDSPPSISCTAPAPVYEGAAAFTLNCSAQDEPSDATYSWTGADLSLLSAANVLEQTFTPPPNVDANTDYDYTVTMTSAGSDVASAGVTVTVLNKPDIVVACSPDNSYEADEGAADITLNCTPSGAPGSNPAYTWSWSPTDRLTNHDSGTPTFAVPGDVDKDTTWTYTVTAAAQNAEDGSASVTVTVTDTSQSSPPPSISCTAPAPVYEGAAAFTLNCSAQDEPSDATYSWTGADLSLLSAANVLEQTFTPPPNVDANTDYDYTVTMTSAGSDVASAGVTVTVLNKPDIVVACSPDNSYEADEGAADITLNCTPSGAPGSNPAYTWSWSPTDRLTNHDSGTPTFAVPGDVDKDTTWTYTVTAAAQNAEDGSASVTVTVTDTSQSSPPPSIACTATPDRVYEGSSDDITVSCSAQNTPSVPFIYAWDGSSDFVNLRKGWNGDWPIFGAPDNVNGDTEYVFTVHIYIGHNGCDPNSPRCTLDSVASASVTVTVLNKPDIVVACSPDNSYEADEGAADITLDCTPSGAPGSNPAYTWSWSPTDRLTNHDSGTPTFDVPGDVDKDTTWTYTVTAAAQNAEDGSASVTVTVTDTSQSSPPPSIACTAPDPVYEGSAAFTLNCSAQDEPSGATYSWTGTDAVNRLTNTTGVTPTFTPPDSVDANTDYDYTVTMTSAGSDVASANVTVTVLEKLDIACGGLRTASSRWTAGVGQVTLNPCSDGWTGAPLGDTYEFSWGGDQKAMNRLNSPNVEKPLFSVPDNVDADTSYNYRVTVSARNADPASFPYRVDVDKRPPPSIVCVSPVSVDEGAAPFTLNCSPRYAPSNATYNWSGTGAADRLKNTTTPTPIFTPPDNVNGDTDYKFKLQMLSAAWLVASANVTVTVRDTSPKPKPLIGVSCRAHGRQVFEGSPDFRMSCSVSGAPPGSVYSYSWLHRQTGGNALLQSTKVRNPIFYVPDEVDRDQVWEYWLVASAQNAESGSAYVRITIRNKRPLSVVCASPPLIHEGSADFNLDCTASGAPGSNPAYSYVWAASGLTTDLSRLSGTSGPTPTFAVPADVNVSETYEYTLTASAANAENGSANITVTVVDKPALIPALSVVCADPGSVYEGSPDLALDCVASGAPGVNPVYSYVWTASGDTPDTALLSDTGSPTPTFAVPSSVTANETYEYTLTASADNAEDASADVTVTVLNKPALSVVCADPGSVYEGSPDLALDCVASGAPGSSPVYSYVWTASGSTTDVSLLSDTSSPTPAFAVPANVNANETYEYTLTASADNAEDASADITVTVLDKGALAVACASPPLIYEGSPAFDLNCTASGAPGVNPVYSYVWTASGDTPDTALLSDTGSPTPTFAVPANVAANETYEYTLTVSADNADDATADVTVTVLNKPALSVVCADPGSVYEGSPDLALDCVASGAPGSSPVYSYVWTASGSTPDLSLLSDTSSPTPTFSVPSSVNGSETYEYTLTASADNADDATADVTITVLNKPALSVVCADPGSVYEGSADISFDCLASGAPGANPVYSYAWTASGDTPDTALLSGTSGPTPTFSVPSSVNGSKTYEYRLTVSADNAEEASAEVSVTVLDIGALFVACASPPSVYEGADDVAFDCSASGAPPGSVYSYVWTARGDTPDTSLLSAADIASPTFSVPSSVNGSETYEYTLTASADNAEDGSTDVTITVLNKPALNVACADPGSVYEGSADISFDCLASGAPPGSVYEYVWTASGSTTDLSLLSGTSGPTPTFSVPSSVNGSETYEYRLTVSADNAEEASAEVSVTVLDIGALFVACASPPSVYEGSDDFSLDCTASGAPSGSDYSYVWTARGDTPDTSLLSAADIASPTFYVPDEVDADETYEYFLTVSADNAASSSVRVSVTVLNRDALAVACADPGSVYEGSDDVAFDCSVSGAPGTNPVYSYAWTPRGDTPDTSLLSAADIESPVFYVPDEVDRTTTYEYLLTVSADNADDATAEVTVTVLDRDALAVACADPGSVYEGSDDFSLDCTASGAPSGSDYSYVWTARGDTPDTSLLSAADIASPTFYVPDEVDADETYEYFLTVSADNADDATAEVTVTVLDRAPLAFVDDSISGRVYVFTVDEAIADILLPEATGGLSPYAYTLAPALPEGLELDDPARTISGTPLEVRPRTEYTWQVTDADAETAQITFFIEVVPAADTISPPVEEPPVEEPPVEEPPVEEPPVDSPPPVASSSSRAPSDPSSLGVTISASPLRFGVQSAQTEVSLDPMTDQISTSVSGPYHAGRMTLAPGSSEAFDENGETNLSIELASPLVLKRRDATGGSSLVLAPTWSYAESCEQLSSQEVGGLYTEVTLREETCRLLRFGGEIDLTDAPSGEYAGNMDVILRSGEGEETHSVEVTVTVVPARRVITIGPAGVRFSTSREVPAGLTEEQNLTIYPDVAFLTEEKPDGVFELSNPSLVPLEVTMSARFGYTEADEDGSETMVEDIAGSPLGDLSALVDIHPRVLVLMPGEKGLVRYGVKEGAHATMARQGYAAFFDVVSQPRRYAALDRMPEGVTEDRTARVTMRLPGVYVPAEGASQLSARLLSISYAGSLSATFLLETTDHPFAGEVVAYDGDGRELGRRETLVYTRSRVRIPLDRMPEEGAVFLRFEPWGPGRMPLPVSVEWNAPRRDIGAAGDKDRARTPATLVQKP